jgi:hypothetical protein
MEYGKAKTDGREWGNDEETELEDCLNDLGYLRIAMGDGDDDESSTLATQGGNPI